MDYSVRHTIHTSGLPIRESNTIIQVRQHFQNWPQTMREPQPQVRRIGPVRFQANEKNNQTARPRRSVYYQLFCSLLHLVIKDVGTA